MLEYWNEHVILVDCINIYSQLGFSTAELQALPLIVLVVFSTVDYLRAFYVLVHFLET